MEAKALRKLIKLLGNTATLFLIDHNRRVRYMLSAMNSNVMNQSVPSDVWLEEASAEMNAELSNGQLHVRMPMEVFL